MTDFTALLKAFWEAYELYLHIPDDNLSKDSYASQWECDQLARQITIPMYEAIDAGNIILITIDTAEVLTVGILGMCTMPGYILRYGSGDAKWIMGGISLCRITSIEIIEKEKKALTKTITRVLTTKERLPERGDRIFCSFPAVQCNKLIVFDRWNRDCHDEIICYGSDGLPQHHFASVLINYSYYLARVDGGPVTVEMQVAEE